MASTAHKGQYVGGHLYEEEMEIFEKVMDRLEQINGDRNQAAALRYIIRNFPEHLLPPDFLDALEPMKMTLNRN